MIVVVLRGRVFVRKHFITLYQTKTKVEKALNKNTLTVIMLTGWREPGSSIITSSIPM